MENFKERSKPSTTVKVRKELIPFVLISEEALRKMFIYTDEVADEVGWLGTAYYDEENNQYLIKDVFLFDQQVHGATTEITPEGLTEFANELLQREDGLEIWNNMKVWGHSHVNMGISPSGQDNSQMEEFSKIGHDFFIRLICNKKGELGIDVYDYAKGIEFHNVPWTEHKVEIPEVTNFRNQIQSLYEQIEEMEKQLEEYNTAKVEELRAPIKEEIKEKVRKFTYSHTSHATGGTVTHVNNKNYQHYKKPQSNVTIDQIDGIQFKVTDAITVYEAMGYAKACFSWLQFFEEAELDGLTEMYSENDLKKIWAHVQTYQSWDYRGGYGY